MERHHLSKVKNAIIEGNVYSPLSTYQALCLLYIGSRRETLDELRSWLVNEDKPIWVSLSDSSVEINNAIFINPSLHVNGFYRKNVISYCSIIPEFTLTAINNWVCFKTHGMIKKVLERLNSDSLAVIINTVYFHSQWKHKFDVKNTRICKFNGITDVNLMHTKSTFLYANHPNFQKLEMPYINDDIFMGVILPNDNIETLGFDIDTFFQYKVYPTQVNVYFPKFTQESSFDIKSIMENTGVQNLFSSKANLSGIGDGLYVDQIIQKAIIIVDEHGTEASAATVITLSRGCAPAPVEFRADKSFYYYIRKGQTMVFVGCYRGNRSLDP